MKKIEKVWPAYLKTNPSDSMIEIARDIVSDKYDDFGHAYRSGIVTTSYKPWQIEWMTDVFDCEEWELFEDVHELSDGNVYKEDPKEENEKLKKPDRYTGKSGMQVFDVINEFGLDFYEGNALKYLIRYKKKNGLEDLKKCRDYLDYMIAGYME
ncbi:hypothetical protein R54839_PPFHFPJH_01370 [Fructobacillus fructosus]|uniref:DUF3310 domain-containing protein n=1 Tax=Fructobacillus fructosus TaxID=1631 RepID=A0ABN9YXG3_9LACO|nr:hypothetical protein R54839_PPFHFPJH_01370 [Fructobacillus fructosus]